MSDPHLVTTRSFNGREYFLKMNITKNLLELAVTDKQTGEEWQCSYDAAYIENITQKTGNYKQFDVFTTMLKSGLLKTSNCVFLDLMTFEDLDSLRSHRARGPFSHHHIAVQANSNRRYLILTYTVEFDRIHYPLPLEYTGQPDPTILQTQIKRLEDEISRLKHDLVIKGSKNDSKMLAALNDRVEELTLENDQLHSEIKRLSNMKIHHKSKNQIQTLQKAIRKLENSVMVERQSHNRLVQKLKTEKETLIKEIERLRVSEKHLLSKLRSNSYCTRNMASDGRRLSESCGKIRGNSNAPKLCRSASWEINLQKPHRERKSRKSRSSSESSGKHLDIFKYTSEDLPKSSRSKKGNGNLYSRSPSIPSSRTSSLSRDQSQAIYTNRDVIKVFTPKKAIQKSPSLDFAHLETRITALQKALFSDRYQEK